MVSPGKLLHKEQNQIVMALRFEGSYAVESIKEKINNGNQASVRKKITFLKIDESVEPVSLSLRKSFWLGPSTK